MDNVREHRSYILDPTISQSLSKIFEDDEWKSLCLENLIDSVKNKQEQLETDQCDMVLFSTSTDPSGKHPDKASRRFICKSIIGYDDPSDEEESILKPQSAGFQKRYLFMSSLSRLLVANREVVTLHYNFDNGSKQLFVTSNHNDSIDNIRQHLQIIINCIHDLIRMLANDHTQEQIENWEEDLTRYIVQYAKTKLARRLDHLLQDVGMKQLDCFAKVSEYRTVGRLGAACVVIAQHMTPDFTETVKKNDPRLHRRLLKVADYVRFALHVSKMCKQQKYRQALSSISNVQFSKDTAIDTHVWTYEKTISAFATKLDMVESGEKYCRLVVDIQQKNDDIKSLNQRTQVKVACHSELHMLNLLKSQGVKPTILFVSKLCCALCYNHITTMNMLNGQNVIVEGTNGKIYDGWRIPEERHAKQAAEYLITDVLKRQFRQFGAEGSLIKGTFEETKTPWWVANLMRRHSSPSCDRSTNIEASQYRQRRASFIYSSTHEERHDIQKTKDIKSRLEFHVTVSDAKATYKRLGRDSELRLSIPPLFESVYWTWNSIAFKANFFNSPIAVLRAITCSSSKYYRYIDCPAVINHIVTHHRQESATL
ncbi:hypothetical protein HDV05_006473 [Chytridiales sp. JEL 0842]|nr:hypothetical protein HDV05_006473 [Chytridiales sp. JEL 0842]